jgi:hypothetical protein
VPAAAALPHRSPLTLTGDHHQNHHACARPFPSTRHGRQRSPGSARRPSPASGEPRLRSTPVVAFVPSRVAGHEELDRLSGGSRHLGSWLSSCPPWAPCHAMPGESARHHAMPSRRCCGCPPSVIRTDTGPYGPYRSSSKFVPIPDTPRDKPPCMGMGKPGSYRIFYSSSCYW